MRTKKPLKITDINRNYSNNISHTITKIKEKERRMLFTSVLMMMFLLIIIGYLVFSNFENQSFTKNYTDGNIITTFKETDTGINDIITLGYDNISSDSYGLLSKPYIFKIKNKSNHETSYKIIIEEDSDMVLADDCEKLLVNINSIKYSLDGQKVNYLIDAFNDNNYTLTTKKIKPNQTKTVKLYMWIDSSLISNFANNHFHGKIIIKDLMTNN